MLPSPGLLLTPIFPPCASTIDFGHCQPQTRTAITPGGAAIYLIETLEDFFLLICRDADAIITDGDAHDWAFGIADNDLDLLAFSTEFEGVIQELLEGFDNRVRIGQDRRHNLREISHQLESRGLDAILVFLQRLANQHRSNPPVACPGCANFR